MTGIPHKHKNQQPSKQANRLKIVFLLTSCYLASAVIIVLITGSLSLLSEAGHMLADVGGLALALFAINYTHKPPTPERTYGFFRMEILASLTNSVVLILLSIYILYEGLMRIFAPPVIQGFPIIIAAAVGLVVNFIGMRLLSGGDGGHSHALHEHTADAHEEKKGKDDGDEKEGHHHHHHQHKEEEEKEEQSLNVKAAYLETLSDTIGAAGVLAAGIIMLTTNFYLADPIISIGLALFMLPRTWSIIKKAIHILMQGSPYNIPREEVQEAILKIRGVTGIFDLHIWTITSGMHTLSAHVVIIDPSRSHVILQEINSILEKKFKITHATIQLERYHSESSIF
ncbi:MAG: cation diffusion facilitator family transporter [Candidatus Nitrosocosmicus sp.]